MARVLFVTSPHVGLEAHGGMSTQISLTGAAITRLGYEVVYHDPWLAVPPDSFDIAHVFIASNETLEMALRLRQRVPHLVVSPIIDQSFNPRYIWLANRVVSCLPKLSFHLLSAEKMCNVADVCVTRSFAESAAVERGFGIRRSRIVLIPIGVDPAVAKAEPDAFREVSGGEEFALYAGAIGNPRKNLLKLIRVIGPTGIRLFVVGPIWHTAYAQKCYQAARNFPNITILGPLPRHLLLSAYAATKVLVLPSLQEGAGIVALEAGLAGAHVAITRRGGPPYYFGEYAHYINPWSSRSICRAVQTCMNEPRDEKMREFLLQRASWEQVGKLHDALYRSLLAGGRGTAHPGPQV